MSGTANQDIFRTAKRILLGIVGVIILVATVLWGISIERFINRSERAKGMVVSLNAGGSHPEIKFTTAGKEIEYPQGGLISGYQPGSEVTVLYDAQNPYDCELDSFGALRGFLILTAILGFCFVGAALFLKS